MIKPKPQTPAINVWDSYNFNICWSLNGGGGQRVGERYCAQVRESKDKYCYTDLKKNLL